MCAQNDVKMRRMEENGGKKKISSIKTSTDDIIFLRTEFVLRCQLFFSSCA